MPVRLRPIENYMGVKAGVCYAHQLVGELPVEPHDVFMDYVVTND